MFAIAEIEGAWMGQAMAGLPAAVTRINGLIERAQERLNALDRAGDDAGKCRVINATRSGRHISDERMRAEQALRALFEAREHIRRAQAV